MSRFLIYVSLSIGSILFLSANQQAFAQNATSASNYTSMMDDIIVNGTYKNADLGLEMEFPEDWAGFDYSELAFSEEPIQVHVISSPFFANYSDIEKDGFVFMMLLSGNITDIMAAEYTADYTFECDEPFGATIKQIGEERDGLKTIEVATSCKWGLSPEHVLLLSIRMNIFATQDGKVIYLAYTATSATSYERHLAEFERSLRSLKLENAMDISDLEEYASDAGFDASEHRTIVKGNQYDLEVITNSTEISDFELDEESRRMSFTVEGPEGTVGCTTIEIGTVLQGPYTVSIDGKPLESDDIIMISDETTGKTFIRIYHPHSIHKVVVSGTNVVPEFPVAAVGAVAAAIGIVSVLGRMRLFEG
jgi:hypothetical protein